MGSLNGNYTNDCSYVVADTLINKGIVSNNRNDYYVSGRDVANRVYNMYKNNGNYVTSHTYVPKNSNYAQEFLNFVENNGNENIILSFNNGWGSAGAAHGHTMMVSKVENGKVYFIDNTTLANPVNSRNGASEYVYSIGDFLNLPYFDNQRQLCSMTTINRR